MSTGISIPELVVAAKKIVWKAKKEGTLKALTPRIIRQQVEKQKSIEEGTLDASEYKVPLKDAIVAAMNEETPASDNEKEIKNRTENIKVEDEIPKKGLPKAQDKPPTNASTKKKGKAEETSKVEEKTDGEATPSPKKTITPRSKPKPKPKTKSKSRAAGGDTDDDEDEEPESAQDSDSEEEWGTPQKKRKNSGKAKAKTTKFQYDSEKEQDEDEENVKKEKSKKVAKERPSKTKVTAKKAPTKKEKVNEDTKLKFKSLEHVPTSDMEQDEPGPEAGPSNTKTATKNAETSVKKTPTKRKASTTADIPTPDSTPRKKAVSSTSKAKPETKPKSTSVHKSQAKESDTELSDLIDEPPKKKRKSGSGKETATKPKEKKKSKGPVLTKDEETIKRLKSFVVACGTRKVWSKVFKDLDTPQQQIQKLKEMLAELGMTGRMSMEQAKAIKEKREFEQELEDVKEFADKFTGRSSRSRDGGKAISTSPKHGHESGNEQTGEDESDEEVLRKPKTTARRSIMAFLEDQSDDDE